MAFRDDQISGAFGNSIPSWLGDWLLSVGAKSPPASLNVNVNETPYYSPRAPLSGERNIQEPTMEGSGYSPYGNLQPNSGSLMDYGRQPGELLNSAKGSLYDQAKGIFDDIGKDITGAFDTAKKDYDSFIDNPLQALWTGAGMTDVSKELGPYADVGTGARDFGNASQKASMFSPIGLFGEAGAGVIEGIALSDRMEQRGLGRLGVNDYINAMLTKQDLRGIANYKETAFNAPENFAKTADVSQYGYGGMFENLTDFLGSRGSQNIDSLEALQAVQEAGGVIQNGQIEFPNYQSNIPASFTAPSNTDISESMAAAIANAGNISAPSVYTGNFDNFSGGGFGGYGGGQDESGQADGQDDSGYGDD